MAPVNVKCLYSSIGPDLASLVGSLSLTNKSKVNLSSGTVNAFSFD